MVDINLLNVTRHITFKSYSIKQYGKPFNTLKPYSIYKHHTAIINGLIKKRINNFSKDTIPVSCKVCLHDGKTHELVDITNSDVNGRYEFTGLKHGYEYYITSYDNTDSITQYLLTPPENTDIIK